MPASSADFAPPEPLASCLGFEALSLQPATAMLKTMKRQARIGVLALYHEHITPASGEQAAGPGRLHSRIEMCYELRVMTRGVHWALLCAVLSVASACDSSSPNHHATQLTTDAAMTSAPAPQHDAGSHATQSTTNATQPTTDAAQPTTDDAAQPTMTPPPEADDAGLFAGCYMIGCIDPKRTLGSRCL